jgi:saccharopine dehydrogenase-like NADP-dependent oxidoreductase
MRIVVLGAGRVGSAMVKDLAREPAYDVIAVDRSREALAKLEEETAVTGIQGDLQEEGVVSSLVSDSALVISSVPGFMGFDTLRRVIKAGKDVVDISFFNEDPFLLDGLAKSKGVTAVVDCGVAPGLCNIIAGRIVDALDETDRYVCYVGGLPQVRQWPFEYKAGFSPRDVLEEYIRPARLVEYGRQVVRPALSEIELIDFPEVGTLEAFNTDGLRTLATTLPIPFMREKTLRYPGHAELMRAFRESGFFDPTAVEVDGQEVKPLSLTSKLLSEQWRLGEGEADFTVMEVVIEGQKGGNRVRYSYYLMDEYDEQTQTTSMARTTGYTCTIVARQLLKGLFNREGICPPEFVGSTAGCYHDLLDEYGKRNIELSETKEIVR